MEMPESGVKSREISILKEFFKYDQSIIRLPWEERSIIGLEGMNFGEAGQIGAIEIVGYYGFTTGDEMIVMAIGKR